MKTYSASILLIASCVLLSAQSFAVSCVGSDRKWRLGSDSRTYDKVGEDLRSFCRKSSLRPG
jgi:hypothetical protein